MLDCHVHIERGEYTLEWISHFVEKAVERGIDELWLLEHCYRFKEFVPMYDGIYPDLGSYVQAWFKRKAGVKRLDEYLKLIDEVRKQEWDVNIKFGLEICYFKHAHEFVYDITKDQGFDFLVGSTHFIDNFAYDHIKEHWEGVDIDEAYNTYFETSIDLATCGIYNGIAHPDAIKLFGHKPSYPLERYYDRLATKLAQNDMYAEQSSGCYRRFPDSAGLGMNNDLVQALKKHGVRIRTASDAHHPDDVGLFIKELGEIL